jgi:hypothetical protein
MRQARQVPVLIIRKGIVPNIVAIMNQSLEQGIEIPSQRFTPC